MRQTSYISWVHFLISLDIQQNFKPLSATFICNFICCIYLLHLSVVPTAAESANIEFRLLQASRTLLFPLLSESPFLLSFSSPLSLYLFLPFPLSRCLSISLVLSHHTCIRWPKFTNISGPPCSRSPSPQILSDMSTMTLWGHYHPSADTITSWHSSTDPPCGPRHSLWLGYQLKSVLALSPLNGSHILACLWTLPPIMDVSLRPPSGTTWRPP